MRGVNSPSVGSTQFRESSHCQRFQRRNVTPFSSHPQEVANEPTAALTGSRTGADP